MNQQTRNGLDYFYDKLLATFVFFWVTSLLVIGWGVFKNGEYLGLNVTLYPDWILNIGVNAMAFFIAVSATYSINILLKVAQGSNSEEI